MPQLVRELEGLDDLVTAQVDDGVDQDEVVDALYRSWLDRFSNCGSKIGNDLSAQI